VTKRLQTKVQRRKASTRSAVSVVEQMSLKETAALNRALFQNDTMTHDMEDLIVHEQRDDELSPAWNETDAQLSP